MTRAVATARFLSSRSTARCAKARARHCPRPMLTVSQVAKSYSGRTLFSGASLQVNRGERIGLVGPNGAGKTTLFSLILGESSPDEGRVSLERGATLGFLPQESSPLGGETVLHIATAHVDEDQRWEVEPRAKR